MAMAHPGASSGKAGRTGPTTSEQSRPPPVEVSIELDDGHVLATLIYVEYVSAGGSDHGKPVFSANGIAKTRPRESGHLHLGADLHAEYRLEGAENLDQARELARDAMGDGRLAVQDSAMPLYDPEQEKQNAMRAGAVGVGTDAGRPGGMPSHHPQVLNTSSVVVSGSTEFNFRNFDPDHDIRDALNHSVLDALRFRRDNGLDAPRTAGGARLVNNLGAEMGIVPNAHEDALRDQDSVNYTGWPLDMIQATARGITRAGNADAHGTGQAGNAVTYETLDVFALVESRNDQGENTRTLMRSPLFKVQSAETGHGYKLVDTQGDIYRDMAHFHSRNNLPATTLFTPQDAALATDSQGRFKLEATNNRRPGNSEALNIARSVVYAGGAASAVVLTFGSGATAAPVLLPVAAKLMAASMALGAADAMGQLNHIHDVQGSFTDGRAINAYINLVNTSASGAGGLMRGASSVRMALQALETTTDIASLGSGGQQLAHNWERMSGAERGAAIAQLAFWAGMFSFNTRTMISNLEGSLQTNNTARQDQGPGPGRGDQGVTQGQRVQDPSGRQPDTGPSSPIIQRQNEGDLLFSANRSRDGGTAPYIWVDPGLNTAYANYLAETSTTPMTPRQWYDEVHLMQFEANLHDMSITEFALMTFQTPVTEASTPPVRDVQPRDASLRETNTADSNSSDTGNGNGNGNGNQNATPYIWIDPGLNQAYANYLVTTYTQPMSPREWLGHVHQAHRDAGFASMTLSDFALMVFPDSRR